MKYTVRDIHHKLEITIDNKKVSLNGYSILDEMGSCFSIVYGEDKRDTLITYLNEYKF